jgi:hypothetical protein
MDMLSFRSCKLTGSSNKIDQDDSSRRDRINYGAMRTTRLRCNRRSPSGWHRLAQDRLVGEEEQMGTCCLSKAVKANTTNSFSSVAHAECRW